MKKVLFILIFNLVVCIDIFGQNAALNGYWKLNASKTDFKSLPQQALPKSYLIKISGVDVTMIRETMAGTGESHRDTIKLTAGAGSYQDYSGTHKRQVFTLAKKTDGNGLVLEINSFNEDNSSYMHIKETISPLNSGEINVVRQVRQEDGGQYEISGIYSR